MIDTFHRNKEKKYSFKYFKYLNKTYEKDQFKRFKIYPRRSKYNF